MNRKVW